MLARTENTSWGGVLQAVLIAGILGVLILVAWQRGLTPTRMVGLVVVVGIGSLVAIASTVYSRRERRTRFEARERLAMEEIFSRYYAESGLTKDVVVRLWKECAETLGISAGKLRPTDRFDHELKGLDRLQITADSVSHLLEDAWIKAKRAGASFDATKLTTLDDLIRQLAVFEMGRSA